MAARPFPVLAQARNFDTLDLSMSRNLFSALSLVIITSAAFADGLEKSAEFVTARQALEDGLPQVSGVKAERLLQRKGWSRAEVTQLATFAAEAWTRALDPERVLNLVNTYDLTDESFWRARALTLRGDLAEAREELTSNNQARSPRSRLLLGQILTALGENDAARQEVEPLLADSDAEIVEHVRLLLAEIKIAGGLALAAQKELDAISNQQNPAIDILRARGFLLSAETVKARQALERALKSTQGGERMHHAAQVLLAEVLVLEKKPDLAWEHLIKLLEGAAQSTMWTEAFDLLGTAWLGRPQPHAVPENVLTWIVRGNAAQQSPAPGAALVRAMDDFRGHAIFITAKWLVALDRNLEAAGLIESLLQLHPGHGRTNASMRLAMTIYTRMKADDRALELVEAWREQFSGEEGSTQVDFLAGDIYFRRGEHLQAQESFQGAANVATTLTERRRALFNAAVAAVQAKDLVLYLGLLAQLEVAGGSQAGADDSAADLELDKALESAAKHQAEAEESLRTFLSTRPYHPRRPEAQIALTECLLLASPARVPAAQAMLDSIQVPEGPSADTDKLRQRIDYTRLWIREASGDLKGLITAVPEFAKAWPQSPLLVDALMKAASAHFQLEDFANARTNFEIVAKEYPGSPQADTALYFAALSAMSVMSPEGRERALVIWDELAKKGGPLAVPSRRQQALTHRRQGDLQAALAVLNELLASAKLDLNTRRLSICEKAEVLILVGKKEPQALAETEKLLRAFLKDDDALPFFWRARAGFTLATALNDAKNGPEALEACYDVLRLADEAPPQTPADYLWFSKAGFFGIELLEAAQQWEPAARLAEQISRLPGDRAHDAKQLATEIRLEHFLWDGPKPVPPVIPGREVKEEAKGKSAVKK
jgi:hypothetical protein